jgi:Protein of unknown function (DUF2281)
MIEKQYPTYFIANFKKENQNDKTYFKVVLIIADEPRPKFGNAKGLIEMSDDFDEPLDDFKEYAP